MSELGALSAGIRPALQVPAAAAKRDLGRIVHPLVFIRHGETDWNRELRLQGQRDIPLNALGRRQATRNGRAVAGILAGGGWSCVSSPLRRTVETALLVLDAARQGERGFKTEPAIQELSYGDWEGLTLAELQAREPETLAARERDKWSYVPPAGESYAMLAKRVAAWLATLDGPRLVVSHGGILRVLLHILAGLPSHEAPHLAAPQDRVILFTPRSVVTL
jgi:probable phosphoglycerate mutase